MKQKPVAQLYHQFLKPIGLSAQYTQELAQKLATHEFITAYMDDELTIVSYKETDKLVSRQYRDELFKIVHDLKS